MGIMRIFILVGCLVALLGVAMAEQMSLETALELGVAADELQGSCFQFGQCTGCLSHPECGWCAESELCFAGGPTGPSCGAAITVPCTLWVWKEPDASFEDIQPMLMQRGAGGSCGYADMQAMFSEAKHVGTTEGQTVLSRAPAKPKLDKAKAAVHDAALIPKNAIILD